MSFFLMLRVVHNGVESLSSGYRGGVFVVVGESVHKIHLKRLKRYAAMFVDTFCQFTYKLNEKSNYAFNYPLLLK